MKKALSIFGGIVAAASIFTIIVVILKKIKLSFSIESADDEFNFEGDYSNDDISVSIEEEPSEENTEDELKF